MGEGLIVRSASQLFAVGLFRQLCLGSDEMAKYEIVLKQGSHPMISVHVWSESNPKAEDLGYNLACEFSQVTQRIAMAVFDRELYQLEVWSESGLLYEEALHN